MEACAALIQDEVSKAFTLLNEKLTAEICDKLTNKVRKDVLEKERPVMFSGRYKMDVQLPVRNTDGSAIKYYEDEYCICVCLSNHFITNYGRIIIACGSCTKIEREAGARLTNEVISYIRTTRWDCVDIPKRFIDAYNQNWAFSVNEVHDKRIKEIEGAAKQAVADAQKAADKTLEDAQKLHEDAMVQARLNAKEREELEEMRKAYTALRDTDNVIKKGAETAKTKLEQSKALQRQLDARFAELARDKRKLKEQEKTVKDLHARVMNLIDLHDLDVDELSWSGIMLNNSSSSSD